MRRADFGGIRITRDWDPLRVRHVGRAVPVLLSRFLVDLVELRKIATMRKRIGDRGFVGLETVRGDLETLV